MPLISIEFALFMLVFLPVYWQCARHPAWQNILLLGAGLFWLYRVSPLFVLAIVVHTAVVALLAYGLHRRQGPRRLYLWLGIVLVLLQLLVFKYDSVLRSWLPAGLQADWVDLIMPLGLSYYSFQSISYLVSLYKDRRYYLPTPWLLLHFSFLPTLTSGPIFRAEPVKHVLAQGAVAQLLPRRPRQLIQPALAVSLILLGLAKKWWWAAWVGDTWVNPVFANPLQYDSATILLGVYGYTVQLFFDFSGYSDLVIGLAMLLGFQLPINFKQPLLAHNIRDFWNRWHISLSTWIRDYIYIPLGGSQGGFARVQLHLLLAMVLSGIWHGQGWTFLIWGLVHGVALVLLNIGDALFGGRDRLAQTRIGRYIGALFTLHIVCFAFVVFRAPTLEDALLVLQALWQNSAQPMAPVALWSLVALLGLWLIYPLLYKGFERAVRALERCPVWCWWLPMVVVAFVIIVLAPSGIPGFIYANF